MNRLATRTGVRTAEAGVTLMEMLVVVALIGLIAAVSFPSVSAGLQSVRLVSAGDSIASLLSQAMNRAERHQVVVEFTVLPKDGELLLHSTEPGFERTLQMPQGVVIAGVHPDIDGQPSEDRRFYFYPGGTAPGLSIEIANDRGRHRLVRINPITSVPEMQDVAGAGTARAAR